MNSGDRPSNETEGQFFDWAIEEGYKVTKRGWPDFFCWKDDKVILVEVKPYKDKYLKREQYQIMRFLTHHGIECYKWTPEGMTRIYLRSSDYEEIDTKPDRRSRLELEEYKSPFMSSNTK